MQRVVAGKTEKSVVAAKSEHEIVVRVADKEVITAGAGNDRDGVGRDRPLIDIRGSLRTKWRRLEVCNARRLRQQVLHDGPIIVVDVVNQRFHCKVLCAYGDDPRCAGSAQSAL